MIPAAQAEAIPSRRRGGRLLSVSQPCPGVKIRDFLRHARGGPRFALEGCDGEPSLAGAGIAAELVAWSDRFNAIERQARDLFAGAVFDGDAPARCQARLLGGFAFQDDFVPDRIWTIWSPAWFVLPHYQFAATGEGAWLTLNAQIAADDDVADTLAGLRDALASRCRELQAAAGSQGDDASARLLSIEYPMSRSQWQEIIAAAREQINAGALQKVVLSRVAEARFASAPNLDLALDNLRRTYPHCRRFLFEARQGHAFFGATPELLADVNGRRMRSMALAGSAPRGRSAAEDEALAAGLLADPKERHEHDLVVKALREQLSARGRVASPDGPVVLKLANIQHLLTPFACELERGGCLLELASRLHPTPALGGEPRESSLEQISRLEPVPRGWYAAPVGCLDRNLDGTLVAAIRSAVCQDRRLWLHAGVGVVADSVAEREWDESELKFQPVLAALGIGESRRG